MGIINSDVDTLFCQIQKLDQAISSIEATRRSVSEKYKELGMFWSDKKYRDFERVLDDCMKALTSIMKTLLETQKSLVSLAISLQDYESTRLGGGGGTGNYGVPYSGIIPGGISAAGGTSSPAAQSEHRHLISGRDNQIAGIVDDIRRGSGAEISYATAEQMLDGLQYYSGSGYSEIRYAYNNPSAPPELTRQLQLIDEYISGAPKWEGTIYRGINVSASTAQGILSSGNIDMLGPSSWSSEESVAQRFAYGGEDVNMVFVLNDNVSGASITHVATYNGGESEVLAPSTARYAVDNVREVEQNGYRFMYVDVHEILQ